jgi:hypothetical protein
MKQKLLFIFFITQIQNVSAQILSGMYGNYGKFVHLKCVANNKVAQVGNGGTNNGDKIYTYNNENYLHFNWQIIDGGDGFVKLRNQNSGKFLAVEGGSVENYKYIVQWDDDGREDIKWKVEYLAGSFTNFKLVNKKSNKILAIEGGAGQGDAKLVQWNSDNNSDKIWQFELSPTPTMSVVLSGATGSDLRAGSNIMLVLINKQGIKRTYKLNYGEAIGSNATKTFTIPVGSDMPQSNLKELFFSFTSGYCFACDGDRWIITQAKVFMDNEITPFFEQRGIVDYFEGMPVTNQYRKIFN